MKPSVPQGLSEVTAIAAGRGFSLALKLDRTIVLWGDPLFEECLVAVPSILGPNPTE
ncbi:hypothetical protein NNL21_02500 [Paenibacillus mendelii]|nr:hypothetical protein [Paenibacillus mendelii]